jgi:uncharacterized caspase-like protein
MRKALAIGINAYPWLGSLSACVDDARSMAGLLERHEDHTRNFDVSELLATDAHSLLDREQLRDQIIALFCDPIDIALLYFAGHGGESEGSGYLLSSDCRSPSSGLSFEELIHFANESPAHNRIVVLDCCFAGHAGNQRSTQGASVLREGTTVLAAARKQETAAEYQDGGLFTALLRDALRGGAADLLGHITPGAVYAHIDKSLGSWEQRPNFKTHTKEFISLRNVAMQIPLAQLHRLTELFPSAQAEFALDPSYEPRPLAAHPDYPSDPWHCAIFGVLQSYCRLNLLRPVGETHMYDAAVHFRSCRLTPLGQHYWTLVKKRRI